MASNPTRLQPNHPRRWPLALLIAYALVLVTATHWPTVTLPTILNLQDKLLHVVCYAGLGVLMYWAFAAQGWLPTTFGGRDAPASNNGRLTIPANLYGNPAVSIPVGHSADGLPIGMQVMAAHHREQMLLDLALSVEQERPWPLVTPGSPL